MSPTPSKRHNRMIPSFGIIQSAQEKENSRWSVWFHSEIARSLDHYVITGLHTVVRRILR